GVDRRLREVGELVVPALVAEDGGLLRAVREVVLPLLGQEVFEGHAASLEVGGGVDGSGLEERSGQEEKGEELSGAHEGPPFEALVRRARRLVLWALAGRS